MGGFHSLFLMAVGGAGDFAMMIIFYVACELGLRRQRLLESGLVEDVHENEAMNLTQRGDRKCFALLQSLLVLRSVQFCLEVFLACLSILILPSSFGGLIGRLDNYGF
jgi:hypothetical protein